MCALSFLSLATATAIAAHPNPPAVTIPTAVQRADSTPADSLRDRPLTVDFVKKVGAAHKQLELAKIKHLDSLARARGLIGDAIPLQLGGSISRDSALKVIHAIVARGVRMFGMPEGRALLASYGLTPEEFAWGTTRVTVAWVAVALAQASAGGGMGGTGGMGGMATAPMGLPVTDADVAFVKEHEADLKAAGFPVPQINAPPPPRAAGANPTPQAADSTAHSGTP